jgi:lysophospholipase L1-like esterase
MANRIQLRRGTAAQWVSSNPVLAQGEPGIETDTGKQKFGNGVTAWLALPYASKGDPGPAGVADDASVKALVQNPASQTATALNATYVPKWKPNTAYLAGDAVVSPAGDTVTAKINFTSGASYSAANWNASTNVAAKLDKTEASATFARPRGLTIVLAGDSRVDQEVEGSDSSIAWSYSSRGAFNVANIHLRHRFKVIGEAGVIGDTVAQLLTRYPTEVLALNPQNVWLGIGVNSVSSNVATDTIKAQITQLFDLNDSIGANSIICTINPKDDHTTAQRASLAELNRWLLTLNRRGVIVVNVTSPVVSATGMTWAAGTFTDATVGLHHGKYGAARMAKSIADTLAPLFPLSDPLPLMEGEPTNLLSNIFMTDGGAGTATGWTIGGTGATKDIVPATDNLPGGWQRVVTTTPTTLTIQRSPQYSTLPAEWAGRRVMSCVEVVFDDIAGLTSMNLNVTQVDASNANIMECRDNKNVAGDTTTYPFALTPGAGGKPVVLCTPPQTLKSNATKMLFTLGFSNFQGTVRFRRAGIMLAD